MKISIYLFAISLLFNSGSIFAKTLNIPLKLENAFIEQLLKAQIFTGKNASTRFNEGGNGCQFVEISNPKVSTNSGELKIRAKARIRFGRDVGNNQCFYFIKWNGYLDLFHDTKISPDGKKITITVKKSEVLTLQLERDQLADTVWQGIRTELYPKLQSLVIDLQEPLANLKTVLPYAVAPQNEKIFHKSIDSLIVDTIRVKKDGVLIGIKVNVPTLVPVPKSPVVKLGEDELALLERKLDALDAFITFTLKQFLKPSLPEHIRTALFGVLFDVRYEIVRILESPERYETDPVRQLFLSTWADMSPILHQISNQNEDQLLGLRILSFITANDALLAIDRYGSELGLDISVNGLRRLARLLNDDPNIDPIERDDTEDPVLRKLLGFSPSVLEMEEELVSRILEYGLDFLIQPVSANPKPAVKVKLPKKMTEKLNKWIPKKKELNLYLPMVKEVLAAVSQAQLDKHKLDKSIRKVYRELVYAAAWQESCWKQFSNVKGMRKPLRSYSGDLGIMQINPRVWRGFYNLHEVKWDIVYNANAGAEILMHYMTRYVIRNKEHIKTGKLENLARATYSGYNGGPSQYTRYRKKKISGKLKQIDRAFFEKYKAVRDKGSMAVKSCFAGR